MVTKSHYFSGALLGTADIRKGQSGDITSARAYFIWVLNPAVI